jgi:hypothetical protein
MPSAARVFPRAAQQNPQVVLGQLTALSITSHTEKRSQNLCAYNVPLLGTLVQEFELVKSEKGQIDDD